ncbi:MAG: hypothetical protein H7282_04485 [Cytophagaceae bacterium]|nr:hypothetical protein [Cytophagaceae bacterium]
MDGQDFMLLLFIFLVAVMLTAKWYTQKYKPKISFTQIMLITFALVGGGFYLMIKNMGADEKTNIIQNVSLKNRVTAITFDPHKPYFKSMTFDDGQHLPMPEAMNKVLEVGDSVYKNKGDSFYLLVNSKTRLKTKYSVAIHERVLSKP